VAFTNDQVGFERDATQVLLDREPRHFNRYNRSGPARGSIKSITGKPITVEYTQETGEWLVELALEQLTDTKADILRTLANTAGPLTAKWTIGVSTTYTVTINRILFDPIIGHYPDGAPTGLRYQRVEMELAVQEEIT
jgi:hypothetical protein